MKKKIVVYIAASLDGYIARENGEIDWLESVEGEGDNGYEAFYQTCDAVVMGKATYDHVLKLTPEFPYLGKKCYVFSRSAQGKDQYVEFINESVALFLNNLSQETKKIWLVGGADILADFLTAKRVDEFIISVIPVLLGAGIPLFKRGIPEMNLKLTDIKQYGQIAQLYYEKE
ncbi:MULTISPECIES: dihydrofolate reductase family protein [Priestia]|uniref:dihydrofolate reductase family protein n=1 Tax=Priestia TaxID=2800373 RepID=UPI000471EE0E|nr:dihydrofolate reductase family protein [Priestia megaterium]MCF8887275.1 dihydrofolate reductase family protein [Priestia megaterium]MDC7769268.1 dihydrofolate reductase family protein [Priestia megaterium]MDW4509036.1 dihydrofolate reductase family protein [Priestia megaterium]MEB2264785.1 dihydrofolate reductase family protein [Priestia megaterium]PEC46729.1 dihydrofolate reductase [Priestia megaterium]